MPSGLLRRPAPRTVRCVPLLHDFAARRKAVERMELPLVVGVDGSAPSLTAVDWAVDEAARHGLPLRLVYASLWERYEGGTPVDSPEGASEELMAAYIVDSATERAQSKTACHQSRH